MTSWMVWLVLVFGAAVFARLRYQTWWAWAPWALSAMSAWTQIWGAGYGGSLAQVATWVAGASLVGFFAPPLWGWLQHPRVFIPVGVLALVGYGATYHPRDLQVAVINLFVVGLILAILGRMVSQLFAPLAGLFKKKKSKKSR